MQNILSFAGLVLRLVFRLNLPHVLLSSTSVFDMLFREGLRNQCENVGYGRGIGVRSGGGGRLGVVGYVRASGIPSGHWVVAGWKCAVV